MSEAAVVDLADHPGWAYKVRTTIFLPHTRDTVVTLKRGEHLFVLHDGVAPIDTGKAGPDVVLILAGEFGVWPVVAIVVRKAHVNAWRRVTVDDGARMMLRVRAAVRDHLKGKSDD